MSAKLQQIRTLTLAQLHSAGFAEQAAKAGLSLFDSAAWKYLQQELITVDEHMRAEMVRAAAISVHTPITDCVMILGPTGTGKETFARAFAQPDLPFVAINCTSLPDYLVESELFGHKVGAFTGAINEKIGLFEAAGSGVLFLDEIGDMPATMQAKLLRVLQQRRIRRVGDTVEREIKCRVVAATHTNVERTLRPDLRWRLCTHTITTVHLAERLKDVDLYIRTHAPEFFGTLEGDLSGNYRSLQSAIAKARLARVISQAGTPPASPHLTTASAQAVVVGTTCANNNNSEQKKES